MSDEIQQQQKKVWWNDFYVTFTAFYKCFWFCHMKTADENQFAVGTKVGHGSWKKLPTKRRKRLWYHQCRCVFTSQCKISAKEYCIADRRQPYFQWCHYFVALFRFKNETSNKIKFDIVLTGLFCGMAWSGGMYYRHLRLLFSFNKVLWRSYN